MSDILNICVYGVVSEMNTTKVISPLNFLAIITKILNKVLV